jgi:hypothetical protein
LEIPFLAFFLTFCISIKFLSFMGSDSWYEIVDIDSANASEAQIGLWKKLKAGTVVVKVGNLLYFEGGLYTRGDRDPSPEERIDYACHAADRGATKYPTVAVWGPQYGLSGLIVIGRVNPKKWQAQFF